MSVSKTSKLLQYINYREHAGPHTASPSSTQGLPLLKVLWTEPTCVCPAFQRRFRGVRAGMRVTVTDGRQMVGR